MPASPAGTNSFAGAHCTRRLVATPHVPPIASQSSSPACRPVERKRNQYMYGRSSRMYDIRFGYGGEVISRSTRLRHFASGAASARPPRAFEWMYSALPDGLSNAAAATWSTSLRNWIRNESFSSAKVAAVGAAALSTGLNDI